MTYQLDSLKVALVTYREALERMLTPSLTTPEHWQQCYLGVLIATARLYLEYLLFTQFLPHMEAIASDKAPMHPLCSDTAREAKLRSDLALTLNSSTSWNYFQSENAFSRLTGLQDKKDYIDRFTLHLPEIHEETFRVQTCIEKFSTNPASAALSQLAVGLQHLGRNHILFVLPALEWAADVDSWND